MDNMTASMGTPTTGKPAKKAPAAKAPGKPAKAAAPKAAPKAPAKPAKAAAKPAAPKAAPKKAAPVVAKPVQSHSVKPRVQAADREAVARRYTIDKDRPTQNGKTRPSATTTGGKLWAALEAHEEKKGGVMPTLEQAKKLGEKLELNASSTVIAYYRWRKFWGVRGRQ